MSGLSDKAKGKFEEVTGKMTGNHEQEMKGEAHQIIGNLKDKADELKDTADEKAADAMHTAKKKLDSHSK